MVTLLLEQRSRPIGLQEKINLIRLGLMDSVDIREAVKEDVSSIVNLWIEAVDLTRSLGPCYTRSDEGHLTLPNSYPVI